MAAKLGVTLINTSVQRARSCPARHGDAVRWCARANIEHPGITAVLKALGQITDDRSEDITASSAPPTIPGA